MTARKASAYFNHGRWVVDCPYCNGGIPGDKDQCPDCGEKVEIEIPSAQQRAAAEQVLSHREIENRNWYPERESVADLKSENAQRGVPFA